MSRGQEQQVIATAAPQNEQYNQNSQAAYTAAQGDIATEQGDINAYQNQLSQFAAANPYGAGGAYQTSTNKVLGNTADAAAQAAGQALQGASVRTGQNTGGAIAATEAMQEQNERNLSGQEAGANASRISSGANYGKDVLQASSVPASLEGSIAGQEAGLTGTEANASNAALGIEAGASKTPGFWDTLGDSFAQGWGSSAGKGMGSCWIAAELYGGWDDVRTVLVRHWLNIAFRRRFYGPAVLALYLRFGEREAKRIRTHFLERRFFRWLFDRALVRAEEWLITEEGSRSYSDLEREMTRHATFFEEVR